MEIMPAHVAGHPLQAYRTIPLAQVSSDPETIQKHADDLDVRLEENLSSWAERMLETVAAVASREYTPGLFEAGNTDLHYTRGS